MRYLYRFWKMQINKKRKQEQFLILPPRINPTTFLFWVSLVAQMVKNPPTMQETWVQFLGWEDLLEKGMATHSSILAWRIPLTEEPGRLQSVGSQGGIQLSNFHFPYLCMLLLLLSHFSHVGLSATPYMAAHQAPLSLGFSRQEHWSGLPFPSPMHESEK